MLLALYRIIPRVLTISLSLASVSSDHSTVNFDSNYFLVTLTASDNVCLPQTLQLIHRLYYWIFDHTIVIVIRAHVYLSISEFFFVIFLLENPHKWTKHSVLYIFVKETLYIYYITYIIVCYKFVTKTLRCIIH